MFDLLSDKIEMMIYVRLSLVGQKYWVTKSTIHEEVNWSFNEMRLVTSSSMLCGFIPQFYNFWLASSMCTIHFVALYGAHIRLSIESKQLSLFNFQGLQDTNSLKLAPKPPCAPKFVTKIEGNAVEESARVFFEGIVDAQPQPGMMDSQVWTYFFYLFTVRSVIIYNILAEKYQELSGDMYLAVTDFPALAVHIKNMEPRSENRQPAGCHEKSLVLSLKCGPRILN